MRSATFIIYDTSHEVLLHETLHTLCKLVSYTLAEIPDAQGSLVLISPASVCMSTSSIYCTHDIRAGGGHTRRNVGSRLKLVASTRGERIGPASKSMVR